MLYRYIFRVRPSLLLLLAAGFILALLSSGCSTSESERERTRLREKQAREASAAIMREMLAGSDEAIQRGWTTPQKPKTPRVTNH